MRKLRFNRPSPAMVVAVLALFVALGGTAAAVKIGSNKIKRGAVKRSKIHNTAVNAAKLANGAVDKDKLAKHAVSSSKLGQGAVKTGKLADGAVTTEKIADDAVTGAKVDDGSLGLAKVARVVANANPTVGALTAGSCEAADVAVSGAKPGDRVLAMPHGSDFNGNLTVNASAPASGSVTLWFCNVSGEGSLSGPEPVTIVLYD